MLRKVVVWAGKNLIYLAALALSFTQARLANETRADSGAYLRSPRVRRSGEGCQTSGLGQGVFQNSA